MANLSASARGLDTKECDDVITAILQNLHNVLLLEDSPGGDFPTTADELASATKALGAAMTQAMNTAKNNPKSLGPASKLVGSTTISLVDSAKKTATLSSDHNLGELILNNTKDILQKTADSLNYAISAAADPSNTGINVTAISIANYHKDSLIHSAKELSDSLTRMLSMIGSGSTNKACEEASDIILGAINKLDNKNDHYSNFAKLKYDLFAIS